MLATILLPMLLAATKVSAIGCATHTFGTCEDNIVHWFDPDDGMVCDPLDCGGGRAPVKYDVPCCAAYRGTEPCVETTSYLSCFSKKYATNAPAESTAKPTSSDATTTADVPAETSSSASQSDDEAPAPTDKSSSSTSGSASVTAPPAAGVTSASHSGNGTVTSTGGPSNGTTTNGPKPSDLPQGGVAANVRYDAVALLVGAAGAFAALI